MCALSSTFTAEFDAEDVVAERSGCSSVAVRERVDLDELPEAVSRKVEWVHPTTTPVEHLDEGRHLTRNFSPRWWAEFSDCDLDPSIVPSRIVQTRHSMDV